MSAGAVTLERVAQDGVRVRASAGAPSFRSRTTLKKCLEEAQEQVEALREDLAVDSRSGERRRQAARERGARERKERVAEAQPQWDDAAGRGVTVFAPLPEKETAPDSWRRRKDGPGVREWRERMETDEGKATNVERPGTAECVNAIARNRGLTRFLVRGIGKCLAVLTRFALTHNVMRAIERMPGKDFRTVERALRIAGSVP